MNFTGRDALGLGVLTGFIGTIIYAAVVTHKLSVISNKLDKSVNDLYLDKDIQIPDELIKKSVERAATEEARFHVEREFASACKQVVAQYHDDIQNIVNEEFEAQKDQVALTIKHKIDAIDLSSIRKEVIKGVDAACTEKLRGDLEEISDKYTKQLDAMVDIYTTVADKISRIGE